MRSLRTASFLFSALALLWHAEERAVGPAFVQFVFTSDAHYGLTRPQFRGRERVTAHAVNAAMVDRINSLPASVLPRDGGLRGGLPVGAIDFVAEGGDIANREEVLAGGAIQSAAASWAQFRDDYLAGLTVVDRTGRKAALFAVPGNHDASNAVGFYRPMTPAVDKTAMAGIYNLTMAPPDPRTAATYDYARDLVRYSRDLGGIHFMFIGIWPDSAERAWMEQDLARAGSDRPVVVFTHDQPDVESKHFRNPNGGHDLNAVDRFENLLSDQFEDGAAIESPAVIEQRRLEALVRRHPNVSAYFHGNSNWNQFYDWTGPDHTIALHTVRVDSPMKGAISANDETRLSFQVVTIDTEARVMTVRECLWNAEPDRPAGPVVWGASVTFALAPRPTPVE